MMEKTNSKLKLLANEYIRKVCDTFVLMGYYYGIKEYYSLLAYPTKKQVEDLITFLDNLEKKIRRVDGELNEFDRIDQEIMLTSLKLLIFDLQNPPYEEKNINPAQLILESVHSILKISRFTDEEKLSFILSRLEQSQALFDPLRQTWQTATISALDETIPLAQNLKKPLTTLMNPLANKFSEKKQIIQEMIASIDMKGKIFAQWLMDEIKPNTKLDCHVLSKGKYQELLDIRKENHDWSERLHIGEVSLAQSLKQLKHLSLHLSPKDGSIESTLLKIKSNLPKVPILEEARKAHQRVLSFMKDRNLLDVPEAEIEIIEPPKWDPLYGEGMMGALANEVLQENSVLEIVVVPPKTEKGKMELNRSFILLAIAHEGAAGHLSSILLAKKRGNVIRLLVPMPAGIDDRWTFYWEQLLREEGLEPTAEYEFQQEYRNYWCSLRHICDVKLHCGLMTFEECIEFLEKECNVPSITAKAYAKVIANWPGYFSSFIIGRDQLIKLREKTKESLGEMYSIKLFHKWIGESGQIPYSLLRREIEERIKTIIS